MNRLLIATFVTSISAQSHAGFIFGAPACDDTDPRFSLMEPGCFDLVTLSEQVFQGGTAIAPTWTSNFFEQLQCPGGATLFSFLTVPSTGACVNSVPAGLSQAVIPYAYTFSLFQESNVCAGPADEGLMILGCVEDQGVSVGMSIDTVSPLTLFYAIWLNEGCTGTPVLFFQKIPIQGTACIPDEVGLVPASVSAFTPHFFNLAAGANATAREPRVPASVKALAKKIHEQKLISGIRRAASNITAVKKVATAFKHRI